VICWSLGVVAGAAALVALAHLHGDPPDPEGPFPDAALATLGKPAVAGLASFALLIPIAWCVRRLRFEFLAWWPGRIVVQNFAANGAMSAPEVERLTAHFRDRLGMSHLQSPAAVPAPAEQGDFLDVLARNGVDSGNLLGSLLSLLRAAFPAYAYEVSGALTTDGGPRPYGVTVHVVRSPGKGTGGHTVWDTSWEGAVRQAADHATAAILPRTRVCRSPWAAWRRYYMPPELLEHYEHAAECEQARRYDEALDSYHKALDSDPMNHGLRLQIGFLQEKLGLYLDALDTYRGILEVAGSPVARGTFRRIARRDLDQTVLVARYRFAVLLGGPGLPRQWSKWGSADKPTRRDEERQRLRERLTPALTELFEAAVVSDDVTDAAGPTYAEAERELPPRECRAAALRRPSADGGCDRLAELFLLASMDRLADLCGRLPRRPMWRRPPLSRSAVRVSSLLVRERLRLELDLGRCEPRSGWSPYIEEIEADIAAMEPRSGFDRWQEHYNVACIWSLPLLTKCSERDRDDVQRLAHEAVERLKQATDRGDTEFLVSRRDWLLSEDPDLQGLRVQPAFKEFEASYFPSAQRIPQRPRDVHRWEVSRYTLDLLRAAAQRWEDTWARRARELEPLTSTRVLLRWCEDELEARRVIRDVAMNHRDWRTRFELLDRMSGWGVEYRFDPIEVPFPGFRAESGLGHGQADVERATQAAIDDKDARLEDLVRQLDEAEQQRSRAMHAPDEGRLRVARLLDELGARRAGRGQRGVHDPGLPHAHAARLCAVHADLWRRLGELVTPDAEHGQAAAQLARALLDTALCCGAVASRWGAAEVIRPDVARTNGAGPARAVPTA
jgi:tetratricopeptide (TPR) repeat protein